MEGDEEKEENVVPVVVVTGLKGSSKAVVVLVVGESSKDTVSKPTPAAAGGKALPTVTGEEPREACREYEALDTGRATTTFPSTQQAFSTTVSESLWVFRVFSTVCRE